MCMYVVLSVQRAPSAPCPAVPSRLQRPSIESGGTLPNNAYAPLNPISRDQPGVYQEVTSTGLAGKKKSVQKQNSEGRSVPSGSSGVYQSLIEPNKDAPSAYAVCQRDI